MIPVFQTLTVANDGRGNCFNACLASLLELPLREVADILPSTEGDWHEQWRVWIASQGYRLEHHIPDDDENEFDPPRGYSIASVYTDRIYPAGHKKVGERISHAVIMFDGALVHDPFPLESEVMEVRYFQKLIPLSDAEKKIHAMKAEGGFCIHGYKLDCEKCDKDE